MVSPRKHRVGIVADTHGLLRPELVAAFQGVDLIVHAGDVGKEEILRRLEVVAPVVAVRGNMDRERWTAQLRYRRMVPIGEVTLYVLHDLQELDLKPEAAGVAAVISGHLHQRELWKRGGVWYVNPGSAGPQRSKTPASAAMIEIEGTNLEVQFVDLS
ncbi:MAG: metallophosphoesterase [Anaerolineae bacterium]